MEYWTLIQRSYIQSISNLCFVCCTLFIRSRSICRLWCKSHFGHELLDRICGDLSRVLLLFGNCYSNIIWYWRSYLWFIVVYIDHRTKKNDYFNDSQVTEEISIQRIWYSWLLIGNVLIGETLIECYAIIKN